MEHKSKGISASGVLIIIVIAFIIIAPIFLVGINIIDIVRGVYFQIGLWFFLIGFGVFLVILGLTLMKLIKSSWAASIAKVGMVMITLSLLVIIVTMLLPIFTNKTITFEECKELVDLRNAYKTMACIFVGYSPSPGATMVTYVNFIITAIICPLAFFYYIFADLIRTMNFPSNLDAQKVIAFIGAYSALRGALATYFIEFFTYGWFGMGALAFGVFMMMMAWALIRKYFQGVINQESVRKIFDMLSQKESLNLSSFFDLLMNIQSPFSFLSSNISALKNLLSSYGYDTLALELNAAIQNASASRNKDATLRNQLANIRRRHGF